MLITSISYLIELNVFYNFSVASVNNGKACNGIVLESRMEEQ